MTDLTMIPTMAAERNTFLAELRCRRLEAQLYVYHLDFIGTAVANLIIPIEEARRMLNELFEPASQEPSP